jgi:hypothetical protein
MCQAYSQGCVYSLMAVFLLFIILHSLYFLSLSPELSISRDNFSGNYLMVQMLCHRRNVDSARLRGNLSVFFSGFPPPSSWLVIDAKVRTRLGIG